MQERLDVHEAVCAERYAGINARLRRMEGLVWAANGGLITTLVAVLIKLF